jgi:hypothetical protein
MREADMRKLAMGLAVGAAALAISAEAGACSYRYVNHAEEPYMADLVRSAHTIELARAVSVTDLLPDARRYGPNVETHRYFFAVEETLKGPEVVYFNYNASAPFPPVEPPECVGLEREWGNGSDPVMRSCYAYDSARNAYAIGLLEAAAGHENWVRFFEAAPFHHNGSGGILPPEQSGGDCSWAESYEINQIYLVFRDQSGAVIATNGLNMQNIALDGDAWLEAVRFFISNPENDWLPAISSETLFEAPVLSGIVRATQCLERPDGLFEAELELDDVFHGGRYPEFADMFLTMFHFAPRTRFLGTCQSGQRYLSLTTSQHNFPLIPILPIDENGMVDLSGVPSQYRIEPSEVSLEDVILWLSEETDAQ